MTDDRAEAWIAPNQSRQCISAVVWNDSHLVTWIVCHCQTLRIKASSPWSFNFSLVNRPKGLVRRGENLKKHVTSCFFDERPNIYFIYGVQFYIFSLKHFDPFEICLLSDLLVEQVRLHRCWLIRLMGRRDSRMHRCVARTIAMLIRDFMKFEYTEKDFPDF